jgi:hypothetical protein
MGSVAGYELVSKAVTSTGDKQTSVDCPAG